MEYIIKSTAILTIFYIFYKIFLQRETFFNAIRSYFLTGIISAISIPFIVITKHVQLEPLPLTNLVFNEVGTTQQVNHFDWMNLIFTIYLLGTALFTIRFLWQLTSLMWFLYTHPKKKVGKYILVKTTKNIAPFSFFNYISYNSNQFNDKELNQILTHEKIHVSHFHSVDIIISQLISIAFWFNPFTWLYHKEIQKNLEYAADEFSQNSTVDKKNYQYLLLKTISPDFKMALASNFYNTLIKKRIDMLQKNRSNKAMQLKFALIIPILVVFVFTYNTKIIAQTTKEVKKNVEKNVELHELKEVNELQEVHEVPEFRETPEVQELAEVAEVEAIPELEEVAVHETVKIEQNQLAFIIDKDNTEYQLNKLKADALKDGINIKIKGVKRNDKGEIIAIKINVNSENSNANFNTNSHDPIKTIKISFGEDGKNISIGNASPITENRIFVSYANDQQEKLNKDFSVNHIRSGIVYGGNIYKQDSITFDVKNEENEIWISKKGDSTVTWASKDKFVLGHNSEEKHVWVHDVDDNSKKKRIEIITSDGSNNKEHEVFIMKSGNNHSKGVNTFMIDTDGKKPLVIVDGKEISFDKMEDLDPSTIESMNVLKGDGATKEYGDKAKDGVIKISTKKK